MTRHLDEMRHYILISESTAPSVETTEEELPEVFEDLEESPGLILEDLNSLIFKLQSYRPQESSQEFSEGLEEGLILASNMLLRLVERHSKSDLED